MSQNMSENIDTPPSTGPHAIQFHGLVSIPGEETLTLDGKVYKISDIKDIPKMKEAAGASQDEENQKLRGEVAKQKSRIQILEQGLEQLVKANHHQAYIITSADEAAASIIAGVAAWKATKLRAPPGGQ